MSNCMQHFSNQSVTQIAGLCCAGQAQVYLLRNYTVWQSSVDTCLKGLKMFPWQDYGLELEVA